MQVEQKERFDLIERGLTATDEAIGALKNADVSRCQTSLELRDMHLSLREDCEQMRSLMTEFDKKLDLGSKKTSKFLNNKMEMTKVFADQALSSVLMVKDVQTLEKKVNVLEESVIEFNKIHHDYKKDVDMQGLIDQVSEMVERTEQKEQEVLGGKPADEQTIENAFRGAIEGLYGMQSGNPQLMEEAKKLAQDLRVFRNAAANKNFYEMISNSGNASQASTSGSSEASFSAVFSGSYEPSNR